MTPVPFTASAVYTAAETAAILRIRQDKLRELVAAGVLSPLAYTTGKRLFSGAEIERFLAEQTGGV